METELESDIPIVKFTDDERRLLDNGLFDIYMILGEMKQERVDTLSKEFFNNLTIRSIGFIRNLNVVDEEKAAKMLKKFNIFAVIADKEKNQKLKEEWEAIENVFKMRKLATAELFSDNYINYDNVIKNVAEATKSVDDNLLLKTTTKCNESYVGYIDPLKNFYIVKNNKNTNCRIFVSIDPNLLNVNAEITAKEKDALFKKVIKERFVLGYKKDDEKILTPKKLPLIMFSKKLKMKFDKNAVITTSHCLINLTRKALDFAPLKLTKSCCMFLLEMYDTNNGHFWESKKRECSNYSKTIEEYSKEVLKLENETSHKHPKRQRMNEEYPDLLGDGNKLKQLKQFLLEEQSKWDDIKIWEYHSKFLDNHLKQITLMKQMEGELAIYKYLNDMKNLNGLLKLVLQGNRCLQDKEFLKPVYCYQRCKQKIENFTVDFTTEIQKFKLIPNKGTNIESYEPVEYVNITQMENDLLVKGKIAEVDKRLLECITAFKNRGSDFITLIITKNDDEENLNFTADF